MLGVVQERAAALFCEEWMEGRGLGQVCSGVSRTWLPLLCEVAPLNKEPEESQKEQAVSQQLRENGATPTGGQARRRNGPASMAASYLNIAQLLGKARGEAQWRRRAGLRSPKPVCNSKEMLFLPQTGCVAAQHWDSVICQWNPAAGGASREIQLLEGLPANPACPLSDEVCTQWGITQMSGQRWPHPAVHSTSPLPPALSPPSLGSKKRWQMWCVSLHCRPGKVLSPSGVSAGSGSVFWYKVLLLPILDQLFSYKKARNSKQNKND